MRRQIALLVLQVSKGIQVIQTAFLAPRGSIRHLVSFVPIAFPVRSQLWHAPPAVIANLVITRLKVKLFASPVNKVDMPASHSIRRATNVKLARKQI